MAVSAYGRRRRLFRLVVVFAAFLTILGSPAFVYANAPDPDGSTQALSDKLEAAARGYYDTRTVLAASQKRQAEIKEKLRVAELTLARLQVEVGVVAAARYKGNQLGLLNGLFTGEGDPRSLLEGAAVADYLVWKDDSAVRQYRQIKDEANHEQQLLDAEVQIQAKQLADLDGAKREAEKALASVGGMVSAGYGGPAAPAQPAPRNADGSLPRESCSINDPTGTGGCVTPRMYHTLTEARLAGFTRYTACWRDSTWGEHPLGRACDFSVTQYGFADQIASGDSRDYGNRLAAWGVQNADALGVLYVIWFRQIWMPGYGWRAYTPSGDPATEHTNHVHISMY